MKELLPNLIESLREELKQYGEMLALLDHQQHLVMERQTADLLSSVAVIDAQALAIAAARRERQQHQLHVTRCVGLREDAGFAELLPLLPAEYRPLIQALVQENNELLVRVQRRAKQNHLLLSRVVEFMQRFINSLSPTAPPTTYDGGGRVPGGGLGTHSFYEAMG